LPPLSPREALDVTMLHSIAGQLPSGGLIQTRPFRDPHHSASMAALVGGGAHAKPGEISLSHRGVLFLDELAEFAKPVLDALRQPLETGSIVVARANHHVTYPAEFQLIAAMNPCRCGYLGDPERACPWAPAYGRAYCERIPGPMLDRFDLIIEVPEVESRLSPENLSASARQLLELALEKQALTARGFHRVLRVARTIANLAQSVTVDRPHLAEALAYRTMPLLA
jgi:magnesium chelatase family protein